MAKSQTQLVTTLDRPIKFLGCSVISFNTQLGWGLDNTSMTVELVEDCEANPPDRFLGKDEELIGTARFLDLNEYDANFAYGGIVTNWVESQSSSGRTYSVTLQDAKQLLSNIMIVTDHLPDGDIIRNNYFNVLSYYEFDSYNGYCYHYGAANSNDAGMNYNNIIQALLNIAQDYQGLSKQFPLIYTPTFPLASSNAVFTIDFGLVNYRSGTDRPFNPLYNFSTEYMEALRPDALPIGPNFYRITGPITLLDLINNICELTGRNFYTSLYYDEDTDTNVIKIHCVHLIDSYTNGYDTLLNYYNGISTDLSYGREFNNPKTRNLILGAPVSYLSQSTQFNHYFGEKPGAGAALEPNVPLVDSEGRYLMPDGVTRSPCQNFWVSVNIKQLNTGLYTPINDGQGNIINTVYISEKDLKAAAASQQLWSIKAFSTTLDANGNPQIDPMDAPDGSLNYYLQKGYPEAVTSMRTAITKILDSNKQNERFPGADVMNNSFFGQEMYNNNTRFIADIKAIYNFVADLASNNYGKKYLTRLNEAVCYKYVDPDSLSGQIEYSTTPTNEGGWVDPGVSVLGLSEVELSSFKTQDGRISCVVRFDNSNQNGEWYSEAPSPIVPDYVGPLDVSQLQNGDYISDGQTLWLKASVIDDKIYSVYDASIDSYVPAIVIELETPAFLRVQPELSLISEQIMSAMEAAYSPAAAQTIPDNNAGKIVGVTIINGGFGYDPEETVRIRQSGGAEAVGIAYADIFRGTIYSIVITDGGEDFVPGVGTTVTITGGQGQGFSGIGRIGIDDKDKYCGLPHEYDPSFIKVDSVTGQSGIPVYNQAAVGFTDLNAKGIMKKAAIPNAAAVPMKSNVAVYGPYVSSNWYDDGQSQRTDFYGGVNVEVDEDLAPWKFGNSATMNTAGVTRAQTAYEETPLVISETGDTRIPGLPQQNLGEQLLVDGTVYGPLVNNINVTFGGQGISSSYSFKTFTRKFGNLSAILTEQIKLVGLNRDKQLKFIRQNILTNRLLARKSPRPVAISGPRTPAEETIPYFRNTSQRVLVGESYDFMQLPERTGEYPRPASSGQRDVATLTTFDKLTTEISINTDKKGLMSLDGFFSAVSVSGAGGLSPYAVFSGIENSAKSCPIYPNPPIKNSDSTTTTDIDINRYYLNPLTNSNTLPLLSGANIGGENISGTMHHKGPGEGHSIEIVGKGSGIPKSGIMTNFAASDDIEKYANDYRFLSLKGPLVLHSWGYDLEGKPVPNLTDKEGAAKSGIFQTPMVGTGVGQTGLQDYFLQDWLQKPATWPVAPVDLRFDRNRGLWVSPPQHKIAVVKTSGVVPPYSSGVGYLVNERENKLYGPNLFNQSGEKILVDDAEENESRIIIEDRIGVGSSAGSKSYAFFDSFSSTYLLMGAGSPILIGKFCNQWPSLSNVKDPANAVKKVILYSRAPTCEGYNVPVSGDCPWNFIPQTEMVSGVEVPVVVEAINLFSNVAAHEYQTKWCALSNTGGAYILLAAEC